MIRFRSSQYVNPLSYKVIYKCLSPLYNNGNSKKGNKVDKNKAEIVDRYVSFMNIDCYQHASDVIDAIIEVTEDEKYSNRFWEVFKEKIPQSYYAKCSDEKVLYHVCSSVFYIEELFEESNHTVGLELMKNCEYQCC